MGATAFRPRVSSRGQYGKRKARRASGAPMASRSHESRPWWAWREGGGGFLSAWDLNVLMEALGNRINKQPLSDWRHSRADE